ncbi:hypothetical protein [Simiduia aestuariiviva]|uniref:Uncharacterized protein n=1 Tax=Simiduia aestuariiviva TaxID=1510459 RepID=A0A839UP10_9GAMM|nr:hypothetical protein [Simiduia aestuariiviva]MBB3167177.1 hypothetical protein [Simiduia aestuariiviva]
MEILLAISGIFLLLVIYVNIKVTIDISRSSASSKERALLYLAVWFIPLLGVLLVPKRILPRFWSSESGQDYTKESGGGMPGGG